MTTTGEPLIKNSKTADPRFIEDMPDPETPEYDQPAAEFLREKPRTPRAKQYERKAASFLNTGFRLAVSHPATLADAAALLMYGPGMAEKIGDLADHDERFRKAVDFITDGSENPYAAFLVEAMPLLLQFVRNHEPVLEPASRGIRIPFTQRRIRLRFGIKLGKLRNLTNDPDALASHVFSNPEVVATIEKMGVKIATPQSTKRSRRSS